MYKVAVIKCNSYDYEELTGSIKRGIELVGGLSSLFTSTENILIKPNILVGDKPEKSVTTHPSLLAALSDILLSENHILCYGDSPAIGSLKRAAEKSGIKKAFDERDVKAADFETIVNVPFPKGRMLKNLPLAKGVLSADSIISVSKMKTHEFTRITGAVKNQFGCIPGLLKGEFHVKMPDIVDFCKVLYDINLYLSPKLFIMDGITAMEGNGPRSGDSINMNTILFSTDPVALDMTFCKLIDLNPEFVPSIGLYPESGNGNISFKDIEFVGDPISELINKNFIVKRKPFDRLITAKSFPPFLKNLISPKPQINYQTCKNCGKCVLQCPTEPKSVNWDKESKFNFPVYDYKSCIRCYCCQEICPHNSISIKTPFLGKLIRR